MRWLSVSAVDGGVICWLPGLSTSGPLRRTIGRVEVQTATLTVDSSTDPDWPSGTTPYASALIALDNASNVIQWGGVVVQRQRGLDNKVSLSLATPEAILDRRYVGDYTVSQRPQSLIMTDLLSSFAGGVASMSGSFGWPWSTNVIDAGVVRDRTYEDKGDKTLYSVFTELSGVQGGPQWTVDWLWQHSPELITPVLTVGSRIGIPVVQGMAPGATFTTNMLTAASFDEDYSAAKGANYVLATSTGDGTSRPQYPYGLIQPGRPVVEYRWSPSTSIIDTNVLAAHAQQAYEVMKDGAQTVSFTAEKVAAPVLGVDWALGDDIGYTITSPTLPQPLQGVAQCIGYDVNDDTITPYLAQRGTF